MALQTRNLVLVGLGVQGDRPLNPMQPPLMDGVHLRWSFRRELGFPWYGFYLFRRVRLAGDPVWLSRETLNLNIESRLGTRFDTPIGHVSSDMLLRLTDDFPATPVGGEVEFDLAGRNHLRFDLLSGELGRRALISIGFHQAGEIQVTLLLGNTTSWTQAEVPVVKSVVRGRAGQEVSVSLEFDAISAIELSSGPAALVELGYVPVAQDAIMRWEPVPDFPNPMSLPLTQADYPCTQGRPEDLPRGRTTAGRRIRYGDPNPFISAQPPTRISGTVSVANGSAIVDGVATRWRADMEGQLLQVNGDATAYVILAVISTHKLVLSRKYQGTNRNGAAYTVRPDSFGQLHDYMVHLVAGGPAAGPMFQRCVPEPIHSRGTIEVRRGSPTVTGTGTDWGADLTGLELQVTCDAIGTATVTQNSLYVDGAGTNWSTEMAGLAFRVAGDGVVYTIMGVDVPAQQLVLDRVYAGSSGSGMGYSIFEKTTYTIAGVDSTIQLTLDQNYMGNTGAGKSYVVVPCLQPRVPGEIAPRMPRQHPLDLILSLALHPAMAQMLGLYWVDQTVDPNISYDYLLVADHTGVGGFDPDTVLARLRQDGFSQLDGYILFNEQMKRASPLAAPGGMQAHRLPTAAVLDSGLSNARNMVGLNWDLSLAESGALLPGQAVMYHIWRRTLEDGQPHPEPGERVLVTQNGPLVVSKPSLQPGEVPERPPDWPSTPLYFIDSGLPDGLYSYQVDGIDIFGRYSPESDPATVRLSDETPPPPPTGIEAFALDPDDPTVLQDQAYAIWRTANPGVMGLRVRWLWTHLHMRQAPDIREFRIYHQPQRLNVLTGRSVNVSAFSAAESIVETDIANNQGPNGYMGAWLRIGSQAFRIVASEAGARLCVRVTNIGPADEIQPKANASLTIMIPPPYTSGRISVVNGSPTVAGVGTAWRAEMANQILQLPGESVTYTILQIDTDNQLLLDRAYEGATASEKAYAVTHPLFIDYADPTNWAQRYHVVGYDEHVTEQVPPKRAPDGSELSGAACTVSGSLVLLGGNPDLSGGELVGESLYLANDNKRPDKTYLIRAVGVPADTVIVDEAPDIGNAPSPWVIGRPVRVYEIFLPAPLGFEPSLAEPIAYAHIGVGSADDKDRVADDPSWSDNGRGGWGGRNGNESRVGAPAQIFRVRRTPAPTPEAVVYSTERVYATPADYHSRSSFTYRWQPAKDPQAPEQILPLRCHIFRALDDSLFKADWAQRPRSHSLSAADLDLFPVEWRADNAENNQRRQDIADLLNPLNHLGQDAAMAHYRSLPDDALRVLAGLPGNESAFTQLTIQPLDSQEPDPEDPAKLRWRNRRGPDDPDAFEVWNPNNPPANPDNPLEDPALLVYIDTLDGRSTNRYFYRAAFVDGAHNRSEQLSLSSPPVYLPNIVPPRIPVITKVLGGDRQITLRWASNREPDLAEYRVYRAESKEAARDLRLMDLVHTELVPVGVLAERPTAVSWTDTTEQGITTLYYRVVALDEAGNVSTPSKPVAGRAYDYGPPAEPTWGAL